MVVLVLLPFISFSQVNQTDTNGLRQGLWKKEYPNGKLMYEGNFRDGRPVGEWKRYYGGGQVKAIIDYQADSDTASAQLFDAFGKKVAEGNYLNEKKEGKWILYSNDRKIAEQYSNGVKQGISKRFYDKGELLETTEWKNGKKEGNYKAYFKSGKPYLQCKFSNDMRNGLCMTSYEDGRTEMEAWYKNNLRDKDWKFYDENGKLLYTLKYDVGRLLNPEVKDSIDNLAINEMEKGKESIPDPEKFMQDPSQYMKETGIY